MAIDMKKRIVDLVWNGTRIFFHYFFLILDWVIIFLSVSLSIYLGGYIMLLGGIADAINLFKLESDVAPSDLLYVLAKIVFAIPAGLFVGWAISFTGGTLRQKFMSVLAPSKTGEEQRKELGYD